MGELVCVFTCVYVELCVSDVFQCVWCAYRNLSLYLCVLQFCIRADFISNQHSYPIYETILLFLVGKPQLPSSNALGCPSPPPGTQPESIVDCVEIRRLKG